MRKLAIVLLMVTACTKKADDAGGPQCMSNADCKDPAMPFCDTSGAYPASNGQMDVCIPTPANCPVEQCGCAPGAMTCGSDNILTTCNADGMSVTSTACALGCDSGSAACKLFTPSHGLASVMQSAASQPPLTIVTGSTIDTDNGEVTDLNGNLVSATSTLVPQAGALPIRAFSGQTVTLGSVSVIGSNPIAFVATGAIEISGELAASAHQGTNGPGAIVSGDCVGGANSPGKNTFGAGGGGNETAGGSGGTFAEMQGGATPIAGGSAQTGDALLLGGCTGGSIVDGSDSTDIEDLGGGGGGAVQLDSETVVHVDGVINVGAGGGESNAGGGAGGNIVIEAPILNIGAEGGLAANGGGGGGGCGVNGADATPDAVVALGGVCTNSDGDGGNGGTAITTAAAGAQVVGPVLKLGAGYGGGGGAGGRALISTADGTFMSMSNSVLSVSIATDALIAQ